MINSDFLQIALCVKKVLELAKLLKKAENSLKNKTLYTATFFACDAGKEVSSALEKVIEDKGLHRRLRLLVSLCSILCLKKNQNIVWKSSFS